MKKKKKNRDRMYKSTIIMDQNWGIYTIDKIWDTIIRIIKKKLMIKIIKILSLTLLLIIVIYFLI